MAWELRKGRKYYYLKVRQGAKVKSVYLGNGPAARAIDDLARLEAEWLSLKAKAEAEGIEVDQDLLETGDVLLLRPRRKYRVL